MSVRSYCEECDTNVGIKTDPHKSWCPTLPKNGVLIRAGLTAQEIMAIDGAGDLVRFAYEHGFHEEGWPRPDILDALAQRLRHGPLRGAE